MAHSCLKNIAWLLSTLFLLANCYDPDVHHELQCNESTIADSQHEFSCGINSTTTVVKFKCGFLRWESIHFNCFNSTPLNITLSFKKNFTKLAKTVQFHSCRFSTKNNIFKIIKHSLQLSEINTIEFDNELIDSSLTQAHLKPLDGFVKKLSFNLNNVSTLPMDLFSDVKTLKSLSIYSKSINSTHLSGLLAPLRNLTEMVLETNNLQELSGNIFADKKILSSLELRNGTAIPSGFLSHLSNLQLIYLRGNNFSSLPSDLFNKTNKLSMVLLAENKVKLKSLPGGLFRDLPHLYSIGMIDCGLESIPTNIFTGSKNIANILISGHSFNDLPLGLFADQENLFELILTRNLLKTLNEKLFESTQNLRRLDLSHNKLTDISSDISKTLTNLEYLSLENNKLLTISSDNKPAQPGSVFNSLIYLNLKNNSINEIPNNIISNFKYLKNLDLSFNKISSLNCNFVRYFESIEINITGNPMNCDFRIMCLQQYIIQKPMKENFGLRTIRCDFPSNLTHRLLHDLELNQILRFPDVHQDDVSNKCDYKIRLRDSVLVMNCSHGNLSDIPTLPMPDESFSNGIELFMDNNPLTQLSTKFINYNAYISLFSVSESQISKLPNRFLSNLTKLKEVSLVLSLNEISDDIFFESTGIESLTISRSNIEHLPKSIFATLPYLIDLDLSKNRLKQIIDFGFRSNRNLKSLRLSHNLLESLSAWTFFELPQLKSLFLDNNRLTNVHTLPFTYTKSLEFLNLENNEIENIGPFDTLFRTLRKLILRNNSIHEVHFHDLKKFAPDFVDLSSNKIVSIDISYLGFININKTVFNLTDNHIQTIIAAYGNISLDCDCKINSLIIDTKQKSIYDSLRCLASDNQKNRRVSSVPEEELLCPINSVCPKGCSCWIRPAKSILFVDCFNASLTEVPPLPESKMTFKGGIELSIEHNQLTSLKTHSKSGYKGVTKIFAAHNKITNISSEDIPESLYSLDVSNNKLERLYEGVIKVINESQNLRSVRLYQNPLKCDCLSENLTRFILMNIRLFPDIDQCVDGRKFIDLSYYKICSEEQSNIGKVIGIALITILAALFVLTILYFNNKERILIWMYAHDICLCWVTEEELDKDKKYDAFISYSSWDLDFVAKNLVSKLESGPEPYKLCLHDRDWPVGGYIPHQIEYSVQHSKRTLIVMSENFLQSNWARLEFRAAHNASMNEKRARVIVIMVDNDFKIDNLDSDLRKYIKMYTYLRWDDPLFWDKLKNALPFPSKKKQQIKPNEVKVI